MRIGISVSSSLTADEPGMAAAMMIERATTAYRVGLSSLSIGDHHAQQGWYMQNTAMLGRLLAQWTDRPAGCLFLLPLWNPVLVAEHVGTLAALVDAPFIVQTGIGAGRGQFGAFGADLSKRGRVTDESIRVIQALLAGETAESTMLNVGPASVGLRPTRPVEWWIGGHAPAALRRAATVGTAWYAGPGLSLSESEALIGDYRTACTNAGTSPRSIVRKDVLVLSDGEAARARAEQLVSKGYRGLSLDRLIVGDVADAETAIGSLAEVGFDDVIIRCMGLDQADALESISLVGELNATLATSSGGTAST